MEKIKLTQTVLVEGRYDKARLANVVDAHIVTTEGFGIFKDKEKLKMLRSLAKKNGLVIVTDADRAGFRIRGYVGGAIPPEHVTHVYIPDIWGKEKRKSVPGKEGKLGVEGIPEQLLRQAFARAGLLGQRQNGPERRDRTGHNAQDAVTKDKKQDSSAKEPITQADILNWGLSGTAGSFDRRMRLKKQLGLPERLSTKGLVEVLNRLYGRGEVAEMIRAWDREHTNQIQEKDENRM